MTGPLFPGADPGSWPGGPGGALVLHGFTGSPQSVRGLAEALAAGGLAVEMPLLPGHGTSVEDLAGTTWADWSEAAEAAWRQLAGRCERAVVAGLSMGGTMACWLAARNPEVAGVIAVNPLIEPPAESYLDIMRGLLEAGTEVAPGIGSDLAQPGVRESAYADTPIRAALSLFEAVGELSKDLARIRCPLLLLSSRQDHLVPSSSGDLLAEQAGGTVERVWLERSYHVATLDYDREEVERRAVAFARRVLADPAVPD